MNTPIDPLDELQQVRRDLVLLLTQPQVIRGIVEAMCYQEWAQEHQASASLRSVLHAAGISTQRDAADEDILHLFRNGECIDSYHEGAAGWLIQCARCHEMVLETMVDWKNDRVVCNDCAKFE